MTKEEALTFLALPETASPAIIKERMAARQLEYETLSEKAPSDFLRRLNARKLEQLKAIVQASTQWPLFTAAALPVQEQPEETPEEAAQTVYIVASLKESVLKAAESKDVPAKRAPGEPAGWLIRHTENKPATTYALQPGKNFVGRKQQPSLAPFIVVEGDDFISRVQCILYAEEDNAPAFYISDPSAFNNGKTSSNGTFINGQAGPVTTKTILSDGDTIQVGVTKLVIRFNTNSLQQLVQEVAQSKYVNTVVLEA